MTGSFSNSFLPTALFKPLRKTFPYVIAVGGGKGGVGKSSIAMMIGLYLAEKGKETVLIDADLTGANLHGYLGVCGAAETVHSFLKGSSTKLTALMQPTSFNHLSAIVGSLDMNCAEGHSCYDARRLLRGLSELPVDYVVMDLGAEGSAIEIDLFLAANTGLIVSSNDSMSLHNVFNFIRSALLRKIRKQWRGQGDLQERLSQFIQETDTKGAMSLEQAFREWGYDVDWVRSVTQTVCPKMILNMSERTDSAEALQALRISISRLLSIRLDFWGPVCREDLVRRAIRGFNPRLLCDANNRAFADIHQIMDRHLQKSQVMPALLAAEPISSRKQGVKNFYRGTLCSTRCLAWRSCSLKDGGMPCAMQPIEVLRREACYA